MTTQSKQIKHELACADAGAAKYFAQQDKLRDKGLAEQTDSANSLVRKSVLSVADALKDIAYKRASGVGGKYNSLLRLTATRVNDDGERYEDWAIPAFIALNACFSHAYSDQNEMIKVVMAISNKIEMDLKCVMFQLEQPAYYNTVMKSFDDQLITDYRHKHRVLTMKFNEFDLKWDAWSDSTRVQIGIRCIRAVLEVLPDVFFRETVYRRGKSKTILNASVILEDWVSEFENAKGMLNPLYTPALIKPLDWERDDETGLITGGYFTPRLSAGVPFIKARHHAHKEYNAKADPAYHIEAVNKMQATPWSINAKVLAVSTEMFRLGKGGLPNPTPIPIPEFPDHLKIEPELYTDDNKDEIATWKDIAKRTNFANKQRAGQCIAYLQIANLAREYEQHERFHFVYNCDFRGRIYSATSGLSPQGDDLAKGLLRFADGVRLGDNGLYWLAVQGANTFGEDKSTYDERVGFITDNEDAIRGVVTDPVSNNWWLDADKPWQFLAFCYEWERCDFGRDPECLGYTAVGLDGSCNGLQHYSAILRDSVGGRSTNLMPSERPEDIYRDVADVCIRLLGEAGDGVAAKILAVGLDRKCAKRPVMTLPYGATQMSARSYIYEWILDNKDKFRCPEKDLWEYAKYLTPVLWKAISEVVVAAREAMDWIQREATKIVRQGEVIKWVTPIGFPVFQRYYDSESVQINTQLNGRLQLRIANENDQPAIWRQRNGIAPNFIHSVDSTHMVLTICDTAFSSYAMVHDDFGTHAGNTEALFTAIRDTFVLMYEQVCPLEEWYNQQPLEDRVELPQKGALDITSVKQSDYFFG